VLGERLEIEAMGIRTHPPGASRSGVSNGGSVGPRLPRASRSRSQLFETAPIVQAEPGVTGGVDDGVLFHGPSVRRVAHDLRTWDG
jgi:hypothetical protein